MKAVLPEKLSKACGHRLHQVARAQQYCDGRSMDRAMQQDATIASTVGTCVQNHGERTTAQNLACSAQHDTGSSQTPKKLTRTPGSTRKLHADAGKLWYILSVKRFKGTG